MSGKFAILEYAESYGDFISNKHVLRLGIKKLRDFYVKKQLPLRLMSISLLDVDGLQVTLPLTRHDAETDSEFLNEVLRDSLNVLRLNGVCAVKAVPGERYAHDDIIPAASGFYVLPFLLPVFLRKLSKMLEIGLGNAEILIVDGISDLTLDILMIIAPDVNNITVLTDKLDLFGNAAQALLRDSGLNINVLGFESGKSAAANADIVLNASDKRIPPASGYKKRSVFFDMAGNKRAFKEISSRREDVFCADGAELKIYGAYVDNVMLETVLLAELPAFHRYVFGRHNDYDFYDVLSYVENLDPSVTAFLCGGKKINFVT